MFVQRKSLCELAVGDKLTIIHPHAHMAHEFRTLVRTTAVFVVDDKGDKWSIRTGTRWGERDRVYSSTCVAYDPKDDETVKEVKQQLRERRVRNYLRRLTWEDVEWDTMRKVLLMLGKRVSEE